MDPAPPPAGAAASRPGTRPPGERRLIVWVNPGGPRWGGVLARLRATAQ